MTTALDTAMRTVEQAANRARSAGTVRLPTTRQLAAQAGVSHTYISKAVAQLKRSGVISALPSRGILLATEPSGAPVDGAAAPRTRWERLRWQLRDDLLRGDFGFGSPLPSGKELAARYGVSDNTLRKALAALRDGGAIVPYRRTHRLAHAPAPRARNTILLFTRLTANGRIQDFSGRTGAYVAVLEQETRSRGVALRVVPYADSIDRAVNSADWRADIDPVNILGCLVWQQDLTPNSLDEILPWVRRHNLPTAALCELEQPYWRDAQRVRNFALTSDVGLGADIGNYLLALGHRRACCLSVHPDVYWSRGRIDGVRHAYTLAGYPDGVPVCRGTLEPAWPHPNGLPAWMQRAAEAGAQAVRIIEKENGLPLRPTSSQQVNEACVSATLKELTRDALQSLLGEPLREGGVTAIVCVNDALAVECCVWLRDQGIDVPRQVSVLGVDDSRDATLHQLTSYSFNAASAMHLMVEYVLRPDSPLLRGTDEGPVQVRGFVHERASTARAHAAT
jgi:DNA-binding LacI/PurR family transcriptional regulator